MRRLTDIGPAKLGDAVGIVEPGQQIVESCVEMQRRVVEWPQCTGRRQGGPRGHQPPDGSQHHEQPQHSLLQRGEATSNNRHSFLFLLFGTCSP